LDLEQTSSPTQDELKALPTEELLERVARLEQKHSVDRQDNQLQLYVPVSDEARRFHLSTAIERFLVGGNGSSKTESNLVDLLIEMTGVIPFSLVDDYPAHKLRPPISARLIVRSLTNTWEGSIKPKLQWNKWTGPVNEAGKGHWGWIPKRFLKNGKWEDSWSEHYRTLTLTNGSTLQINSHTQEVPDQASASLHRIAIDEGCKHAMYRENMFRLREGGYISIAMTPPDEESASWDAAWVYDIYEKGLPGPNKDPDIDSFTLFTEDNPHNSKEAVEKISKGLTPTQYETRMHGAFMHLGGRIYKTYTDLAQTWCFTCNQGTITEKGKCLTCHGGDIVVFCHLIEPNEWVMKNPCVFLMDPHPRKPVMMSWVVIDPYDDWTGVAELEVDEDPEQVAKKVKELEGDLRLDLCMRIIDPNMGRSPAHSAGRRHITVADEYSAVGLRCNDRASDDFNTGRLRIAERLKPDSRTRRPRLHFFNTLTHHNQHFKKFTWDEWTRYSSDEKDLKAKPRSKWDDYPILMGYLANENPSYSSLKMGNQPIRRQGRRGGY